jgi:murein DD-endopeptidase MepM/ murein hydrolase activator NlpD
MWKKWKESECYRKLRELRVNRAVYLSAIVVLLSLAVVFAVTAATNRAKKDPLPTPEDTNNVTDAPNATEPPLPDTDTTQPEETTPVVPRLSAPTVGKLTKAHSADVQVFSPTLEEYRVHLGIDIVTAESAPVCAVANGTVAQIWEDPLMGTCVALSHTGEALTVYKNLAAELAEGLAVGKTVLAGELLGYVGETAIMEIAEEPHLHMEMTVKGLQVDPMDYFSAEVIAALSEDEIYEDGK